jgi:endonuclease/exonuclease/phosphatase family metal-dependent hydrolase
MLTVASWNIQKGVGTDFRRRVERTADVAASAGADVIGLQEVVRTAGCDQAEEIARRLGCDLAWGPARAMRGGTYGNALLVRGRVLETRVHDLSVPRWEPRACLEALVESRGARVRVFVCHLGLGMRERTLQIARVMKAMASAGAPRVVLGDFNEWNHGAVARAFDAEFPHVPRPGRTHPSPWPLFSLDRVAWDPAFDGEPEVMPVRGASDHRMVRARLSSRSDSPPPC